MLDGFKALPLKYKSKKDTWHEMFIKEFHQKKQSHPLLPDGKTILVLNVPPYVNEIHLKFGFCRAGPVAKVFCLKDPNDLRLLKSSEAESVYFSSTRCNDDMFAFKSAFIVFENSKATRKAMTLDQLELYVEGDRPILVTGIPKWTQQYMALQTNEADLEREIEGYLDVFDAREKESKVQQQNAENVDDEGWQTVGKSGRIPKFVQSEQVLKRLQNKIDRGSKKKELADFYKFQKNDGHRNRKRTLKVQFSAEKEKLEELRQKKRLKTFESS